MTTRKVASLMLLGFAFLTSWPAYSGCKTSQIKGLYGLATQGLGASGIRGTTLSIFDFNGSGQVSEIYFVNTGQKSWKSSASGTYSVSSDCAFLLSVKDQSGTVYALEGQLNPRNKTINVLQTQPNNELVSSGVVRPVGVGHCKTRNYLGKYAFLSQGNVPSPGGTPGWVPESRVGWFFANGSFLEQPVQLVNINGLVVETPPTQIASQTLESCLIDIDEGGFAGVILDRGQRAYYMDLAPGSYRLGLMRKVR